MNLRALKLCLVTNRQNQSFSSYQSIILKAVKGGITCVQLREKTDNLLEFRKLALQFKTLLRPFNVPLIINDHVDIAKDIDAEGVHIGQSDMPAAEARKILGPSKIIGLSIETLEELEKANQLPDLDYVAASAVFPTKNKLECKTYWGIEGLRQVSELSKHPVVAIGGINLNNIGSIIDNGACGVAVIGAIHDHEPALAATHLITKIDHSFDKKRSPCLRP